MDDQLKKLKDAYNKAQQRYNKASLDGVDVDAARTARNNAYKELSKYKTRLAKEKFNKFINGLVPDHFAENGLGGPKPKNTSSSNSRAASSNGSKVKNPITTVKPYYYEEGKTYLNPNGSTTSIKSSGTSTKSTAMEMADFKAGLKKALAYIPSAQVNTKKRLSGQAEVGKTNGLSGSRKSNVKKQTKRKTVYTNNTIIKKDRSGNITKAKVRGVRGSKVKTKK